MKQILSTYHQRPKLRGSGSEMGKRQKRPLCFIVDDLLHTANAPPLPPPPQHRDMQIFVKKLNGESIAIDVDPDDSIDDLLGRLQGLKGVMPEQRLAFLGRGPR
jgi:hypothetical protein